MTKVHQYVLDIGWIVDFSRLCDFGHGYRLTPYLVNFIFESAFQLTKFATLAVRDVASVTTLTSRGKLIWCLWFVQVKETFILLDSSFPLCTIILSGWIIAHNQY